jgi:hypothetical protein
MMGLMRFGRKHFAVKGVISVGGVAGWKMERQQLPPSLHMSIMPRHATIVDRLVEDLRASVEEVVATAGLLSCLLCGGFVHHVHALEPSCSCFMSWR